MLTIAQALTQYSQQLATISLSPRLEVEILLMEILRQTRAYLIAYSEQALTRSQQRQLRAWAKRRQQGEPMAYIVGHQPFWTLDLIVTPQTLIPRPETELLVEWILHHFSATQIYTVADLGTGTGAIALALAKERPLWHIDATDINPATLAVAQSNAEKNAIRSVNFYAGVWCDALPDIQYDIIVSNPPYIGENDPHLAALKYEPVTALVSQMQGKAALENIMLQAKNYLRPSGYLILEHGAEQSDYVQQQLKNAGYEEIIPHRDLALLPRFVTACWKGGR